MNRFWAFLHGVGGFASFVLPPMEQHYPYIFPEEALTRDWEAVGRDLKNVIKRKNLHDKTV